MNPESMRYLEGDGQRRMRKEDTEHTQGIVDEVPRSVADSDD